MNNQPVNAFAHGWGMKKRMTTSGIMMIRATVRTFAMGKVTGWNCKDFSAVRMKCVIDRLSQLATDAVDLGKVIDAGTTHPLETPELAQQFPAPARTQPWHGFQDRLRAGLAAARPMAGDGKAMRFVAHSLN